MWLILAGASLLVVFVLWLVGERGTLLLPSTSKFIRMAGPRRLLNLTALHGYVYLRLQKQYLKFLIRRNAAFPSSLRKWFTARYHSKVLTQDQAKKIITIDKDIPLQNLEQVIPHERARSIVLKASHKIVAFECPCRHARPHPCQPTQVCLFIGEPYAEFMLEEEHARGHLHSAWFKDALMDRFYAICNCCKCCCGGIENMVRFRSPQMASSGYVAETNAALCEACGACVAGCPFQARSLGDDRVVRDWDRCMGCGVCVGQCPNNAVALVRDERKGVPLEVGVLS
jgi:ferredoxin